MLSVGMSERRPRAGGDGRCDTCVSAAGARGRSPNPVMSAVVGRLRSAPMIHGGRSHERRDAQDRRVPSASSTRVGTMMTTTQAMTLTRVPRLSAIPHGPHGSASFPISPTIARSAPGRRLPGCPGSPPYAPHLQRGARWRAVPRRHPRDRESVRDGRQRRQASGRLRCRAGVRDPRDVERVTSKVFRSAAQRHGGGRGQAAYRRAASSTRADVAGSLRRPAGGTCSAEDFWEHNFSNTEWVMSCR